MTAFAKSAHGAPCNGCGACCRDQVCPLGMYVFGRTAGPCPALEPDGPKAVCGLVRSPARYAPVRTFAHGAERMRAAAALLIGAGHGCDAQAAGEPADLAFRARMRRVAASHRAASDAAKDLWGVPRSPR